MNIKLEVLHLDGSFCWSNDLADALPNVRLVLEKEPFLTCRLVVDSVESVNPELALMLAEVRAREVRYSHHRDQFLACDASDLYKRYVREGAPSIAALAECLRAHRKALSESFFRSEVELGFVSADQLGDVGEAGDHEEDSA